MQQSLGKGDENKRVDFMSVLQFLDENPIVLQTCDL
jgi:hypothetical protein